MRSRSSNKYLGTIQLVALIFLTVSGGPYGLEPLLVYGGEHAALLLLILTPLLWDIPTVAAVLELNSMMPVQGGYYHWVKRALGLKWAFYEGWWTWIYTFVDLAIYPVLFITYLGFFFPDIVIYKVPICLCIIWFSAIINILGVVPVGKSSVVLSGVVLLPFIILVVIAFNQHHSFSFPALSFKGTTYSSIGMGLYTVMWNFIGWDNTTTYAEKVDRPVRTYLVSTICAFMIIFIVYFLVVYISQLSGINPSRLAVEGYPALGVLLGGNWLGAGIAIGGMASSLGLFSAVLLSVSRVPKVMADDHLLPRKLNSIHLKFGTPYISIIACATIVSFMILWTFTDLIIIDVTLYGAALVLEYVSLIALRIKVPAEHRPFKIPLNITGLIIFMLIPIGVYAFALSAAIIAMEQSFKPIIFAIACLVSAEIIWRIILWKKNKSVSL